MQLSPLSLALTRAGRISSAAGPNINLIQETNPVIWQDSGTNTASFTFPQATTAGTTLIVHCSHGYFNTLTLTDSGGGTVAGGQWTKEIDDVAFATPGDGDPLANQNDRQHVWVRRNCPAGITNVSLVTSAGTILGRIYIREVSGLSNVAPIVRVSARNLATQTASSVSVSAAGFVSILVRTNPSATPVSASTGSVVRRVNFLTDNTTPYTGAVSEHTVHGISTGARTFDSSWPDGASSIGYHGVFIPAA
jgi:hypothetical protein